MKILLVTGSRALNDTAAARAWAMDLLCVRIGRLPYANASVWTGGCARSPDTWAEQLARKRGLMRVTFSLDGWIYRDGKRTDLWSPAETEPAVHDRKTWPLVRNAAMIERLVGGGNQATVLALRAPWACTHGTEHTVELARRAGIVVEEQMCPAEHGRRA